MTQGLVEVARLSAVRQFADYDLHSDAELQQLISMASKVCETPVALITLIDEDKQWLKVRMGTDVEVLPVDISFCSHAILQDEVMVVPDMLNDGRFITNPFVVNEPKIRFYAGAPLTTRDGYRLGTLCVLDQEPHKLSKHKQEMLKMLSRQAINIMELKLSNNLLDKHARELAEQKTIRHFDGIRLRSFFENSVNFHVLLGKYGEIIDYNKTAYSFIRNVFHTKLTRGRQLTDFLTPDFMAVFLKNYQLALNGTRSTEEGVTDYQESGKFYWEATFEPARDNNEEIIGISYLISNITKRKLYEQKILAQKQSLLNIAYIQSHEIRGPLSSIMGMVNLIKMEPHNLPEEYIPMLESAVNQLDQNIHQIIDKVYEIDMEGQV